jgi:hypothetical protein
MSEKRQVDPVLFKTNKMKRIVGMNCLWSRNPAVQASQQVLICIPYVNFGVKNCPIARIRWYPNLKLRLLKGTSGASGHTYIAEFYLKNIKSHDARSTMMATGSSIVNAALSRQRPSLSTRLLSKAKSSLKKK